MGFAVFLLILILCCYRCLTPSISLIIFYADKELKTFDVNEKKVAQIIAEVSIARRDAERKLDEIRFDEKREINKAKNLMKARTSKNLNKTENLTS
ncbi:unnamed protein product [Schistosoma margrebowiei]|uniref:Uncharacterized protein n=1 Tax=Schistosoma margrebowiei TaxID=48269 RepID=A0A183LKX1_9TREM|nr:unnamed protein product [Schistosoma margrebowiei]